MSEKLINTYEWQPRALGFGAVAALLVLWMLVSRSPGALPMSAAVLVLYACFAVQWWASARGAATIDDDRVLHVRNVLRTSAVTPGEVAQVKEIFNGRSPDVKLITQDRRRITVPTSKLHAGHSTLFRWLAETQPEASYDKGAERLRSRLDSGGYLDGSRNPLTDDSWGLKDADAYRQREAEALIRLRGGGSGPRRNRLGR